MSATDDILKASNTFLAAGLAGNSAKFAKKKRKTAGDCFKAATTNVIGTSLIKSNEDFLYK
jgi:hypothetical protein